MLIIQCSFIKSSFFDFFLKESNHNVMAGYNLAQVDQQPLDNCYFCTHHGLVLQNALQTKCGHFYCTDCLPKLYNDVVGQFVCREDEITFTRKETFEDRPFEEKSPVPWFTVFMAKRVVRGKGN